MPSDATAVPKPASIEVTDPIPVASPTKGRAGLIAASLIAVVGIGALVFALTRGGGDDDSDPQPSARPVTATIDAAPVVVATPPDAAPVIAIADAAIAVTPRPKPKPPVHKPDPAFEAHLAAAEKARKAKRWLKVVAEADQALKIDPRHRRAAFLMGEAQLASGDKANGCKYLKRAGSRWGAKQRYRSAGCDD